MGVSRSAIGTKLYWLCWQWYGSMNAVITKSLFILWQSDPLVLRHCIHFVTHSSYEWNEEIMGSVPHSYPSFSEDTTFIFLFCFLLFFHLKIKILPLSAFWTISSTKSRWCESQKNEWIWFVGVWHNNYAFYCPLSHYFKAGQEFGFGKVHHLIMVLNL